MSRSLIRVWLLFVCLGAGQAFALGLGEIRLESALNEPLRADIVLISATPEELDNLTIQLADTNTFSRYGIDRPVYLRGITFEVIRSGRTDGNVVRVRSIEPMTEPFLTFLVEAVWSRGRLLREYTLLLDPPTFAPPPADPTPQVVQPAVRSEPADSGQIRRETPAPAPAPTPAPSTRGQTPSASAPTISPAPAQDPDVSEPSFTEPTPAPTASFDTVPGGDYSVVRGDTLWGIASRMRPDNRLTMNQTMLAIYEANQDAFSNNINMLSAGATLRIPSADEVFRINRADALAEVQRQNSAWGGVDATDTGTAPTTTSQPSLTLVPPDEDALTGDDSTTVYDGADLGEPAVTDTLSIEDIRIQEIEDLIADQQDGLVIIEDNELAALRRELAELRGEPIPDDLLFDDAADDEFADDEFADDTFVDDDLITDDAVFADDIDDAEALDDAAADDAIAGDLEDPVTEQPAPTPVATQPQQSLVDQILGYATNTWTLIGAALLIVAGVLVWFSRRGRSDDEDMEATGLWEALDADDLDHTASQSTERLRAMAREDDASIVVVEQETAPTPAPDDTMSAMTSTMEMPEQPVDLPTDDPLAATDTNKTLEDTFSSETAINLDQSDPIAEADFHMAYGLYDQAADLINGALAVETDRQDLMAKLCEIYFVWGNRDAFIDAAQRLKTALSGREDPEWDKIVIMGQQIAADHELFSDVSAAGATKAVDLAFDEGGGETGALDMDLAAEPGDGGDVIDLGAESQSTPAVQDASSIDFMFEDAAQDGQTAITEEMPAADPFAGAFEGKTQEMPTMESDLSDGTAEMPTVETPLDDDTTESPTIEEQLAGLEATGELPALSDNEATEVASLDDEPRAADATAEIDLDDLGLDLDAMQGSLNDDEATADLTGLDDTSESPAFDDALAATGRNEVLDELDITGTNEALSDAPGSTGFHDALDVDDALTATSELDALETVSTQVLADQPLDDDDDDIGIDTSLLDATGQTQILPDDFAVETGTGTNIEQALADEDATMLSSAPSDSPTESTLADDAETLLASLDDDDGTGEFDFAKTEALPKEAFTGDDATTEMPVAQPGSTDMDLDLDDLTAALQISAAGDTVNQVRDDATVEQPRPQVTQADPELDEATAAIAPEELSDDLHDARTMTEVGTKLDLARAYVDMGDPSGARGILEEVLDEGDESQRQQARQLLESLPS